MDVRIRVTATVESELLGEIPDEIWKAYQDGVIDAWTLYENYFELFEDFNLNYEVTGIDEISKED